MRGIEEDYEGVLFVLLGYPKGKTFCKPRKERIFLSRQIAGFLFCHRRKSKAFCL